MKRTILAAVAVLAMVGCGGAESTDPCDDCGGTYTQGMCVCPMATPAACVDLADETPPDDPAFRECHRDAWEQASAMCSLHGGSVLGASTSAAHCVF